MHTKHDPGGTSSPVANIRGSDLRPSLIDVIALGLRISSSGGVGTGVPYPFVLKLDNIAARIFAGRSAQCSKLKHIGACQEWVRTLPNRTLQLDENYA